MLKEILHKLLRRRHPWRDVSFDELSEIYASMMLRSLALSMIAIFIPVYLYRLDYSITAIMSVFAMYFSGRVILDIVAAHMVARFGPKHTILFGQMLQIASSALFLTLPSMHWPLLLVGFVWGASASFFYIPFHVDFSKIKHSQHGGKELGFEQIMEKTGAALGPLAGGLTATLIGPRYIFLMSIVILLAGMWPLFRTREPVRTHQKLDYTGLAFSKLKPYLTSHVGLHVENTLCLMLWPLFLAVIVIPGAGVFAKIGILASVSVFVSIMSAYIVGRTVDKHFGRKLLRISAITNGLLHLGRPFVTVYPVAFAVNFLNEMITVGYRLPYTKGFYDLADDLPGYRIVYISTMEALGCLAKAIVWWVLIIASMVVSVHQVFIFGFALAALASFLMITEKFEALKPLKV